MVVFILAFIVSVFIDLRIPWTTDSSSWRSWQWHGGGPLGGAKVFRRGGVGDVLGGDPYAGEQVREQAQGHRHVHHGAGQLSLGAQLQPLPHGLLVQGQHLVCAGSSGQR